MTNGSSTYEANGGTEMAVIAIGVIVVGFVLHKIIDDVINPLVKRVDLPEVIKSINRNFNTSKNHGD